MYSQCEYSKCLFINDKFPYEVIEKEQSKNT